MRRHARPARRPSSSLLRHLLRAPALEPQSQVPRRGRGIQEAQQELQTLGVSTGVATAEYPEPQAEHQEALEAVAAATEAPGAAQAAAQAA